MTGYVLCVGCGARSPEVNGEQTLVSKLGWRLRRAVAPDGTPGFEWRCASCWAAFKSLQKLKP
jgi:hypothetical protein